MAHITSTNPLFDPLAFARRRWRLVLLAALGAWPWFAIDAGRAQSLGEPAAVRHGLATGDGRDTAYSLTSTWGLPAAPAEPIDVAVGPGGLVYAADGRHNRVEVYAPGGALVDVWDHPPVGASPDFIFVPRALAANQSTGMVYVLWLRFSEARALGGELVPSGVFLDTREPDGTNSRPLRALPSDLGHVVDMALHGPSGDLYIDDGRGTIHHLAVPSGLIVDEIPTTPAEGGVGRIAVLDDGRIAVAHPPAAVELVIPHGATLQVPLPGGTGVALSAGGGRFHVLAAGRDDPEGPFLFAFATDGSLISAQGVESLGAPSPGAHTWPWSLDVTPSGQSFTTAAGAFQTLLLSPGQPRQLLVGSPALVEFSPKDMAPSVLAGTDLAMARGPDDRLVVLDGHGGRLIAFGPSGEASVVGAAPVDGVDVALDAAGARYVTTRSGSILRYSAADPYAPGIEVPCDCSLGGRLAVHGDVVYVTRPRSHRVAVIEAKTGRVIREVGIGDAVGLWPSDVASDPDAGGPGSMAVLTSDLVNARLHGWDNSGAASGTWAAGLLAGPRRLGVGRGSSGELLVAGVMADGFVELHRPDDGNLAARFRPTLPGGATFDIADVAVGGSGRLLLADAAARAVRIYDPVPGVEPTPVAHPSATPFPGDAACRVHGEKTVLPSRVNSGATVQVTLTLAADCPVSTRVLGADVVLVLDRSGSMHGANMAAAKGAARTFVELLDVRYHRIALASFSSDASIDVPLTSAAPSIIDGLELLHAYGETNIAEAVRRADVHLADFGRVDALPVIVLLTDGRHNMGSGDPRVAAADARNRGVQLYTIGLGAEVDGPLLQAMAGSAERYFTAPGPAELFPIYSQILRLVVSSLAGNLVIDDHLSEGVLSRPGSARPPALEEASRLRWGRSLLPSTGITLTYQAEIHGSGALPLSRDTVAEYTDGDGVRRTFRFPAVEVEVMAPTPTPTSDAPTEVPPTPPTPTVPTLPRKPIFLPIAQHRGCIPSAARIDAVLVIDTSSSMAGAKLEHARAAAGAFIALLDLPADQAAIVSFDATARVAVHLTGDRAKLVAGLDGLAVGTGTRIDDGLRAATFELVFGAARNRANRPAIVLLSDGGHGGTSAEVTSVAAEARRSGIIIYAVGLGPDADETLLREVAGRERTIMAPRPEQLAAIYRDIAVRLPCR